MDYVRTGPGPRRSEGFRRLAAPLKVPTFRGLKVPARNARDLALGLRLANCDE
jgi:hypothetical protein